jgi:hypothetical protein
MTSQLRFLTPPPRRVTVLLFLSSPLVYLWMVPHIFRVWWVTGDEPHYLMMTHSLVWDQDLDLGSNYVVRDRQLFSPDDSLDAHTGPGMRGGQYS